MLLAMGIMHRLPRGSQMTHESWRARHRILTGFLWAAIPLLLAVGLLGPRGANEAIGFPIAVALFAVVARTVRTERAKAELTSLGLVSGSFVGIELSGGRVHAHLYILSAVALVALYQRWTPLVLTVVAVVLHHLTLGLLAPDRVFSMGAAAMMDGHPMAAAPPSFGAVIVMVVSHAFAVVLEVAALLLLWHFAEASERETAQSREVVESERRLAAQARLSAAEQATEDERLRAEEAAAAKGRLSTEAEQIRSQVEAATAALAALDDQASELRRAVREVSERCQHAAVTASTGQRTADTAATEVNRLERAMGEISEVNQMIAQLAAQTNLLSLNATIEAARAGERGKGFAVVAQEVKALANETAASAEKVRDVIDGVVEETANVARSFATTSALVGQIQVAQTDIAASVEHQAAVLSEVARQTATAAEAAGEINAGLNHLLAQS